MEILRFWRTLAPTKKKNFDPLPAEASPVSTVLIDSGLAERLTLCRLLLQQKHINEAVKATTDTVVAVLNSDKSSRDQIIRHLDYWPQLGAELVSTNQGYVCRLVSSKFSWMQAAAYLHFIEFVLSPSEPRGDIPKSKNTVVTRIISGIDVLIDHFHYSKSGVERKRLCMHLNTCKSVLAKKFRSQSYPRELINTLSKFLHEPAVKVKSLLESSALETRLIDSRRNTPLSRRQLLAHQARFEIAKLNQYQQFLRDHQGSRIIASFHLGDYIYGINHLMALEPRDRNALVMRQQSCSFENSHNVLSQLGERAWPRSSHIISNRPQLRELTGQLRQGNTSLVLFCDLPESYGETVKVSFLGRPARFPKGPALLAVLGRAPLLPVINIFDGEKFIIHIGNLIDSSSVEGEGQEQYLARITQELINVFEPLFLKYPEQWRYLNALPSYFK